MKNYNGTLYLLRAVSGSGKTTLAKELEEYLPDCVSLSADDFHYDEEGNYNFKFENLGMAHSWCQSSVKVAMQAEVHNIIVHNTNTTEKEIKPYLDLAEDYDYKVVSLVVENRHGNKNVHAVPDDVVTKQRKRLEGSLKL